MRSFDVIIIGKGVTGLSTAFHLNKAGFKNICLLAPPRQSPDCASLNAGYASVTLHDNITRAAHGLGTPTALDLLRLNQKGYCGLMECVRSFDIEHSIGQVLRIADSAHEARELGKAVKWLSNHGFPASLSSKDSLTIQIDGAASASVNVGNLLDRMELTFQGVKIEDNVRQIKTKSDHVVLETNAGELLRSELVVVACHTGIRSLLPKLSSALVNHADQWMEYEVSEPPQELSRGNLVFSGYSNYWVSAGFNGTIRAGGARFLRKWAGIEAESPTFLPEAEANVRKKIESLFSMKLGPTKNAHGLLDLRSCDEIPIIGPIFGDDRILVAGGYMGTGLTFGFAAGIGLTEFILNGQSKTIPPVFHPKRLRSLPDTQ